MTSLQQLLVLLAVILLSVSVGLDGSIEIRGHYPIQAYSQAAIVEYLNWQPLYGLQNGYTITAQVYWTRYCEVGSLTFVGYDYYGNPTLSKTWYEARVFGRHVVSFQESSYSPLSYVVIRESRCE